MGRISICFFEIHAFRCMSDPHAAFLSLFGTPACAFRAQQTLASQDVCDMQLAALTQKRSACCAKHVPDQGLQCEADARASVTQGAQHYWHDFVITTARQEEVPVFWMASARLKFSSAQHGQDSSHALRKDVRKARS